MPLEIVEQFNLFSSPFGLFVCVKNKKINNLLFFVSVLIFVSHPCCFVYVMIELHVTKNSDIIDTKLFGYYVYQTFLNVTVLVTIFENLTESGGKKVMFNEIKLLSRCLEKYCEKSHRTKTYEHRSGFPLVVIEIVTLTVLLIDMLVTAFYYKSKHIFHYIILITIPNAFLAMAETRLFLVLKVIQNRYARINDCLMAIYKQEKRVWETGEVFVSIDLGRDGYSLTQSQIMKIHSRLTRLTANLCHTFSLQIGCEIVNFFIGLVINIFFLVNFSTKKVTFTNPQFVFTKLLNSYWAVFFLCKLWFIIYNFVATQKKVLGRAA